MKAGLNGVMMGNFLTALGAEPEEDRAMFEELGLNVARQPDNGTNPRPDNRSGWLEGETPNVIEEHLAVSPPVSLDVRLWDPSTQLHYAGRRKTRSRRPPTPPRVTEPAP